LSRLSIAEIRQHVITQGLVAELSGATLWRWLSSDALRSWQHRSWIFPRDPHFAAKASLVLDLYERIGERGPLGPNDFVISADEKTSIQADAGNNRPYLWLLIAPYESSTSTFVRAPGLTWQLGTSTEPKSSAVANTRLALLR